MTVIGFDTPFLSAYTILSALSFRKSDSSSTELVNPRTVRTFRQCSDSANAAAEGRLRTSASEARPMVASAIFTVPDAAICS